MRPRVCLLNSTRNAYFLTGNVSYMLNLWMNLNWGSAVFLRNVPSVVGCVGAHRRYASLRLCAGQKLYIAHQCSLSPLHDIT